MTEEKQPRPQIEHLLSQYQALRSFALVKGLFNADIRDAYKKLDEQAGVVARMKTNLDNFGLTYGGSGWVKYDSLSAEIVADVLAVSPEEGEAKLIAYHLRPELLTAYQYRFFRKSYSPWRAIFERVCERIRAEDYLSAVPLILIIIDGICTSTTGKHPFSGGADVPVFDTETCGAGGLSDGLALLGATRRKLSIEPIAIPFRHGIVHGLNPVYDSPVVAAKAVALLFAIIDYFDKRSDETERLVKARHDQNPPSFREIWKRSSESREMRRALDSWQARPPLKGGNLAASDGEFVLPEGTPELAAAQYLAFFVKQNYGEVARATVDYPRRSIASRAGRIRKELGGLKVCDWRIVGVVDNAPALSEVTAVVSVSIGRRDLSETLVLRLTYTDEVYDPLNRGHPNGRWYVMPNFLADLERLALRA